MTLFAKSSANLLIALTQGQLSQQAHVLAVESEPEPKQLETIEIETDAAVAELWSITPGELADIKFSLADLR